MTDATGKGFKLFDYRDEHNRNDFKAWTLNLEKVNRVKLNQKLDLLQKHGLDLLPQILAGPIYDHVYKLRVKGNVQLRPILSKGPIDNDSEFTLLLGAFEVGSKLKPEDAKEIGADRRTAVIKDPGRRCKHERVK